MAGALKELQKAVEKQEKRLEQQQWEKYHKLIDIAVGVLKHENVLLYGGAAINSLMPPEYKFYSKTELMDIDVYFTSKTDLFRKLINAYKKEGFSLVNIYDSIHTGTYKVQVEGVNVLDLHLLSQSFYRYLKIDSRIGDLGIRCASITYLRSTFYKQLAEPLSARRWAKVFERLILFNRVFPIGKTECELSLKKREIPHAYEEATKKLYDYIKTTPYMVLSADVYLLASNMQSINTYPMSILVQGKMEDIVDEFMKVFSDIKLTPSCAIYKDAPDGDIPVCTLSFGKIPFLKLYFITNYCLSYITYRGVRMASIPTTIRYYSYIQFIHYRERDSDLKGIECIMNLLFALHIKSLRSKSLKTRTLFKQFTTDCYGEEAGLITRKKERLVGRLKEKYGEDYLNQMKPVMIK